MNISIDWKKQTNKPTKNHLKENSYNVIDKISYIYKIK